MASQPTTLLTPEEYLALERKADFKSEYHCILTLDNVYISVDLST